MRSPYFTADVPVRSECKAEFPELLEVVFRQLDIRSSCRCHIDPVLFSGAQNRCGSDPSSCARVIVDPLPAKSVPSTFVDIAADRVAPREIL